MDLVTCHDGDAEVISRDEELTLPHPFAHLRAFVLIPWLAVDPDATLTVAGATGRPACSPNSTRPSATGCASTGLVLDGPRLMGPTRKRDLTAATVIAAVLGYLLVVLLYRWFPPITVWTGLSLLAVAIVEAGWAFYVRAKINDGEIGDARGWLHPLAVARSVLIAKASAWVGALVLGWWVGVLVYLCPGAARCGWPAKTPRGRWWPR